MWWYCIVAQVPESANYAANINIDNSQRKHYTKEFKLDAVSLVTDQGYSVVV